MSDPIAPARTMSPLPGVILLLLFACLPYGLMISALPASDDFPGGGGGEATVGWGMQQFIACVLCALLWLVLWLALFVATRKGNFASTVRFVRALTPMAGVAATVAVGMNFDTPGIWLALVPMVLPPVIAGYTLARCVPGPWRGLPPARLDMIALSLIGALSIAIVPLAALDASMYPARLAHHKAEQQAQWATSQKAAEQQERSEEARFQSLGPDSSLRDYLHFDDIAFQLTHHDQALAGARAVKSRQSDAVALLGEWGLVELEDLWRLDLQPTPELCAAYARALEKDAGPDGFGKRDVFGADHFERQVPNMRWLVGAHCDLDVGIGFLETRLRVLVRDDPFAKSQAEHWNAFLATLAELHTKR